MKPVIVGTAGHIDHGKTALVKALTGIDADRLEEEKRRGITIDIGFAHLELPGENGEKLRLGFVDVPGHERFVRNMLAGVGGIDLVLLVIAADESIKPQTREHFDICRLLRVERGITVLTKSDLVDSETLEVVRLEIEEFLRGSFLDSSHSPIVAVSSRTGAGLDQLKQELIKIAAEVHAKDSGAIARLPIDRVFTMKGFGTVITGTLIAGTIRKDDELEIFPGGRRARVRAIQVHGKNAERATAGERTALNLAGVTTAQLARGMALARPATFRSTNRVDVSLSLLQSAKPLKHRSRVHLHAHTSETIATVLLYDEKQIALGQTAFVQLRLDDSVMLLPGDRFIIRQFSPVVTIGGGVVLDAAPPHRVSKSVQKSSLGILASGDPTAILQARIERRGGRGLSRTEAIAETGWRREQINNYLRDAIAHDPIIPIGDLLVASSAIEKLKSELAGTLAKFHKQTPLVAGMSKEALREAVDAEPAVFGYVVESLANAKNVEISGELVRLPGRGIVMKDEEAESKQIIERVFASAGLKVPALHDVLAGLKVDRARAQKLVTLLLRDKVLIKISDELVFHSEALHGLRRQLGAEKLKSPKMNVARFKDLTGVSRKYAIPLLEYLDRERITRRVGDERVIL
jgi:selenocysteine-specific elongation factor